MVHVYRSRSHPRSARAMRYILQQHNSVPHISCMPPCQSLGASRAPPKQLLKCLRWTLRHSWFGFSNTTQTCGERGKRGEILVNRQAS